MLPYHRNRLYSFPLLCRKPLKVPVQALFLPIVPDILHRRSRKIADQSDIAVPPAHRLFRYTPGLIPADPQGTGRSQYVALPQHNDRKPLKQRIKKGHELATVRMTPRPLGSMIVDRHHRSALRIRPPKPLLVSCLHIDPLLFQVRLHTFDSSGFFETQKVPIEFCVMHGSNPPWYWSLCFSL